MNLAYCRRCDAWNEPAYLIRSWPARPIMTLGTDIISSYICKKCIIDLLCSAHRFTRDYHYYEGFLFGDLRKAGFAILESL